MEQEVFRLEVSMHNPKGMTSLNKSNNDLCQLSSLSLTVVAFLDNPIKELSTLTELHYKVNTDRVFIGTFDLDNMRILREMVHYLNLPANILVVIGAEKLAFWDGLAGIGVAGGLVSAEKGGSELALPQFSTQGVELCEVLGPMWEDPCGL